MSIASCRARRIVAGVVLPAGRCGERELLGSQQVLHPQLGGIHAELVGEAVDDALDEVDRLGDAERARVGDATGRLVRVHARDLAVRGAVVVGAGEDVEEAGRVLRRLGGGVERTVVGDHVDAEPDDLAVARRGDRALHVVVAGEAGRHQVLGAVLHPLDRLAGDDRADDRAHVAGIDRHLVAEAAADVGRDHLDLVLGQAGDERVHGAVGVWRLRVRPERELAGHGVHVGDGAARLHRRGVRPRVQHVLRHDDVGAGEHRVGGVLVAGLPVEDVVVRLALFVVADHRRAVGERLLGVHHRVERFVHDVDQLDRVACRVVVLGDDERDLLTVEAHLVGGEHRLGVVRQRRHPCQPERVEDGAGDDGFDLRVGLGRRRVDRDDPGVRVRAAQDRAVQHAGQVDVVDVVAPAAQEPDVLLARHAAEPDRVAGGAERYRVVRCRSHAVAPCSIVSSIVFTAVRVGGRPLDGLHDVVVAGAAAQLPREPVADLLLGGVRVVVEQPAGGEHHPRRAEPALQAVAVHEALLDRIEHAVALHALDGVDRASVGHRRQHRAALHRHAVHVDDADPAVRRVASPVGARQAQLIAEEVHEQRSRLGLRRPFRAVDRDGDLHVRPPDPSLWRPLGGALGR